MRPASSASTEHDVIAMCASKYGQLLPKARLSFQKCINYNAHMFVLWCQLASCTVVGMLNCAICRPPLSTTPEELHHAQRNSLKKNQMTENAYKEAWHALGSWLEHCVQTGHGAHIPNLGKVTVVKDTKHGHSELKPTFQVSDAFAKTYQCRPGTSVTGRALGGLTELSALTVALQHSNGLDKQQVADGIKHIVTEIGHQVASGKKVRTFRSANLQQTPTRTFPSRSPHVSAATDTAASVTFCEAS
jgi:nucleoid DNA-binding protein